MFSLNTCNSVAIGYLLGGGVDIMDKSRAPMVIATELLTRQRAEEILFPIFKEIRSLINGKLKGSYDFCYDQLVSFGEILSTTIVYNYLSKEGDSIGWLDAREVMVTDSNYREAGVNFDETNKRMPRAGRRPYGL